jgi:hypothetical protein
VCGCKCSSFVAFRANDADTPVYCASRTKTRGRATRSATFNAICSGIIKRGPASANISWFFLKKKRVKLKWSIFARVTSADR